MEHNNVGPMCEGERNTIFFDFKNLNMLINDNGFALAI